MEVFTHGYEAVLYFLAKTTVCTLEIVGILIILIGSAKTIIQLFSNLIEKNKNNIVINLGKTLALALEFKMGAEIVNTVIIRDLEELKILTIIIALRAILALLIHWEIKNEKKLDLIDLPEIKKKNTENN